MHDIITGVQPSLFDEWHHTQEVVVSMYHARCYAARGYVQVALMINRNSISKVDLFDKSGPDLRKIVLCRPYQGSPAFAWFATIASREAE